jgi:hypothetical protein
MYKSHILTNSPKSNGNSSLLDQLRQQSDEKMDLWKPDPGDGIEGTVVKITTGGKYNSTFFHLKTDDGYIQVIAAGADTDLGRQLCALQIELGDRLAVIYDGERPSKKGHPFKKYRTRSRKPEKPKLPAGSPFGD